MRPSHPVVLVLVLVLVAGCAGGSSGSSSGGTSAAATASSSGPDATPPAIEILEPARGAFLPLGPVRVRGRATDAGSGVVSVLVQGTPAALGGAGEFTATVQLEPGVASIAIRALDAAGNRMDRALSVETGDYLAPGALVPEALAGRINQAGLRLMERIAASVLAAQQASLGARLQGANPVYSQTIAPLGFCMASVEVSLDRVSFGTPVLALGSSAQGLTIRLEVPQLAIDVSARDTCGVPFTAQGGISADKLTIDAVARLGVGPGGALDVTFPSVSVDFDRFHLSLGGALSWVAPLAQGLVQGNLSSAIEDIVRTDGADAIRRLVAQQATGVVGGSPAAFSYGLQAISTDADGIAFDVAIDVAIQPDPSFPAAPGSLLTPAGSPAAFARGPAAVFSISESAINRALEAAWQAGLLATEVEPAVVAAKFGVPLPFGATAQDLALFFPQLRAAIPQQSLAAPLVFTIRSLLPPTASLEAGAPDPLRLHFGEYHITAAIDLGGGARVDVFTVSMQAEIQLGVAVQGGFLAPVMTSLPNPIILSDLIAEPLAPLGAMHLQGYLDSLLPILLGGITSNLPPLPLPGLPAGATLVGATVRADGASGKWLTVEADVR